MKTIVPIMDLYLMAQPGAANPAQTATADAIREDALRWFDELHAPLRRYLLCAGCTPADADDAVQEAFLRLHRHLAKGGDCSNVYAWIFQVARNFLRDERKSARQQRTVALDSDSEQARRWADPSDGPEHSALSQERFRRLSAAIQKLAPQQRECVLLRSAGLRYREIADVLGIQISSVGSTVQRALARLREELS